MLHRRMIGEQTAPLLFTMEFDLEPYNRDVLDQGVQIMTVKKDGIVMSEKYVAGHIPEDIWKFMQHFGAPSVLTRTGYNTFRASICGTADRSNIFPDPHDEPYIYRCGLAISWPFMLPSEEYYCEMVDKEDHFDVVVDGTKVGELKNRDDKDRVSKLRHMLKNGYQATAQIETARRNCHLFVVVRKV